MDRNERESLICRLQNGFYGGQVDGWSGRNLLSSFAEDSLVHRSNVVRSEFQAPDIGDTAAQETVQRKPVAKDSHEYELRSDVEDIAIHASPLEWTRKPDQ